MNDDLEYKFKSTDVLRKEFQNEKQRLNAIKAFLQKYKNNLQKQSTLHQINHDTKKNKMERMDIYKGLNDVEHKLIKNENAIYEIQQYIDQKGAESNYQNQFQDCMQLLNDINMELIKKCMSTGSQSKY